MEAAINSCKVLVRNLKGSEVWRSEHRQDDIKK
jgi:hypothetical protein